MRTKQTLVALTLLATTATGSPALAATPEDYSMTIRHDVELDEVIGTAKDVGGTWSLVLEWRTSEKKDWEPLAGTGPVKGMKKRRASNVVRGDGFDFTGSWRACVIKKTKRTCTDPISVD